MQNTRTQKAFTLIELLIVIAIIGILAVALLPSIMDAPAQARDASRKSALNDVILAIESFKATNGRNPGTASECITEVSDTATAASAEIDSYLKSGLENLLEQKQIKAATVDFGVCNAADEGILYVRADANRYSVCTTLERAGKSGAGYYTVTGDVLAAADSDVFCIQQ